MILKQILLISALDQRRTCSYMQDLRTNHSVPLVLSFCTKFFPVKRNTHFRGNRLRRITVQDIQRNDFRTGPYFIMHAEYTNYAFALLFCRRIRTPKEIEYIHG